MMPATSNGMLDMLFQLIFAILFGLYFYIKMVTLQHSFFNIVNHLGSSEV